jgi:hypothetical protein
MDPATRHRTLQLLHLADERATPHHIPGEPYKYKHGWIPVILAGAEAIATWNHDLSDKHHLVTAVESGAHAAGPIYLGDSERIHTVLGDFGNGAEHLVTTHLGPDARRNADSDQLASELARSIGIPAPRVLRIAPDRSVSDFVDGPTWAERERQILDDPRAYELVFEQPDQKWYWENPKLAPAKRLQLEDLQRQRSDMLTSDAGVRMGVLDLLAGIDVRDSGTVVLGPDGVVPVQSEVGWPAATAERIHTVTEVPRQPIPGVKLPKGMKLFDASHRNPTPPGSIAPRPTSGTFRDGLVTWQAFARGGGWLDNPLTAADITYLRQQLDAARPAFVARNQQDWWQFSSDRLDALAAHATGTVDLFAPTA